MSLWAIKAKDRGAFPHHSPKPKAAPAVKLPEFHPAGDVKKPLVKRKPKQAKVRSSVTPGTVLIILTGRFKGKGVAFLKLLPSGLLLVTGPFKVYGVPLRRLMKNIYPSKFRRKKGRDEEKFLMWRRRKRVHSHRSRHISARVH